MNTSDSQKFGPIAVVVAAFGFGLSPYFATRAFDSGVSPVAASFIRVLVMFVVLSPWAREALRWRRESLIVAVGGIISMIGFAGFYVALDRAPVAAATVVYYTYPVVVLALSAIVWRRRPAAWEVAVCLTVLIGVGLAVGPIGMSSDLVIALAPAFAAPIGWAVYLMVLSGPAAAMPTMPKVFAGAVGGVIALSPLAMWETGGRLMPLNHDAVMSVGLLTLCTLAIPAVLVTWGASRSGERATAMIGSFEFVVAVAAGWLLLDDHLTTIQIGGVVLVLAAASFAATHRSPATQSSRTSQAESTVRRSHAATRSVSS